ncbi:Lipase [Operophtera brumata]|uniref:Lipase n=1 Tax=Operophtera brumata TaxID=104452 RepID=A0A0L7L8F4_OPEBR|nr:Lipase [Operophtera brumata]
MLQAATAYNLCSHDRAWRYYVEAISSPTAFPASAAADYDSWIASAGQSKQSIYLGDLTNTRAQGNFYLTTNSKPDFGKGAEGMKPIINTTSNETNTTSLTKLLLNLR